MGGTSVELGWIWVWRHVGLGLTPHRLGLAATRAWELRLRAVGHGRRRVEVRDLPIAGRPVRLVNDRHGEQLDGGRRAATRQTVRLGAKRDGTITAFEIDDLTGIGPYSMYPRTSAIEANQVVNLVGGPYATKNYRARARVVFQNKNVMCQYRAVGHPIATAVTEGLVEMAAVRIGTVER